MPIDWPKKLSYRRGSSTLLRGLPVHYDFDWYETFDHNRSTFRGGQSLADVILGDCPEGKTPCLLLTELEGAKHDIQHTDDHYVVIIPIQEYLKDSGADVASSYFARRSGAPLTQLSDAVPADVAAALQGLEVEDATVLEEFVNYVTRVGNGSQLVRAILSQDGGEDLIRSLIDEGGVTSGDIVNTAYRKRQLEIFEKMLGDGEYWKEYAGAELISESSEEKVWQHFFFNNDWIFGYGLDYRFNGILQKEFHASGTQADGSQSVITDFLLGDKKFTTFVEIKKPSTPIFGNSQNRSLSWRLSNDLIEGVSQILEHKASGEIKIAAGEMFDENGNLITQKAVDAKVILLIGDWSRVSFANDLEKLIKEKTFELYRRDSRNIKMLTYDELLERARFIVQHKIAKPEKPKHIRSGVRPAKSEL